MLYIISCPGGCAPILKNELKSLGYPLSQVLSPSTLQIEADEIALAKINLWSRIANKVYIVLGTGIAPTFERLFEITSRIDRSKYITDKQPFIVNARSNNSLLTSVPSIQSMGKKAISKKLMGSDERWEEDETIPAIEIMLSLDNNNLQILLDTTGESLHRRSYRTHAGDAPLKENLAAALILSTWRKFRDPFIDITCWAWTLPIEAAMIAKNIAPWLKRNFAFEDFARYSKDILQTEKEKAIAAQITDKPHTIIASDIDATMIAIAKENAANAWVAEYIDFSVQDMTLTRNARGCYLSNPPYWQRMAPENLDAIYDTFDALFNMSENYGGIITSYPWEPSWNFDTKTFYNGPELVTFRKKKL